MRLFIVCCLCAGLIFPAFGQDNAEQLVRGVYAKMRQVKSYEADMRIDADIPMLRMQQVDGRLLFKQPHHLQVKSKSLAVLPKQGFADFGKFISDTSAFTAVFSGEEKMGNVLTRMVQVLPANSRGDLILAKLWIDPARKLVMRSELTFRSSGTVLVDYTYGSQSQYALPDQLRFTMDVRNMKIPKAMTADLHQKRDKKEGAGKDPNRPAVITVKLYNYQLVL
jgi:outer membrane lipoprotein-sorting protein